MFIRFPAFVFIQFIMLLLYPSLIFAQVNIEQFRKTLNKQGFSGNVALDISSRTGNVDVTELTIENRTDYLWKDMNTFIIARGDYGWEGGDQYSDEALVHVRHVFRLPSHLQPEVFAQVDYNKKRRLMFRGLGGGGVRFALQTGEKSAFWYGTTFIFEHERLDVRKNDSHEKETTDVRWSNYITTNITFTENLQWTSTTYLQPCIGDFGDIRILHDMNITIAIIEQLSWIIGFQMRYDSEPPDTIKSLDTTLRNGLALSF